MSRFKTPLRYPGGKAKLTEYIRSVLELNSLSDCHYAEVYAGGAGVGISLLMLEYATQIHLNDINPSVYAFWQSVLKMPDELCALISKTDVTVDEWRKQKVVQNKAENHSFLELGFSTFFLNRTNRSGIIRGGVIGGKEQAGKWKLDVRFNKTDLISRIQKIATYSDRIHLTKLDAIDFISNQLPLLPKKTFIYLDPPYYVKGEGLYENHYKHNDHEQVSKAIASIQDKSWLVSYDNVPAISKLYEQFEQRIYGLKYSAQSKYTGSEVMIYSPELIVPEQNILMVA